MAVGTSGLGLGKLGPCFNGDPIRTTRWAKSWKSQETRQDMRTASMVHAAMLALGSWASYGLSAGPLSAVTSGIIVDSFGGALLQWESNVPDIRDVEHVQSLRACCVHGVRCLFCLLDFDFVIIVSSETVLAAVAAAAAAAPGKLHVQRQFSEA